MEWHNDVIAFQRLSSTGYKSYKRWNIDHPNDILKITETPNKFNGK